MSDVLSTIRFTSSPKVKVGLIHLERKRPWPSCVNEETGNQWWQDMKTRIVSILDGSPFSVYRADVDNKVDDDPSLRKALACCRSEGVDVLVAIQPVISDGRLAPVMAQQWENCVVMWGTPEEQKGEMISGNSLVGTHLMSSNLRQLGYPCQLVYGNLDWVLAEEQLMRGVAVAYADRYLAKSKLGLVGYQAPGFQDFHPNPFLLRKTFGSLLLQIGSSEFVNIATKVITDEEVAEDLKTVTDVLKLPFKSTETGFGVEGKKEMEPSSRYYLAMKKIIKDNNLDGLSLRCWPELPGPCDGGGMDQWCYMALARLATEGFPIACEGDVDGTLSNLVAKLLGCGPVYISDWLEHDKSTVTLWHGGIAPVQLSEAVGTPSGPVISRHFNNKKVGCLDATIKIGIPVTLFRIWIYDGKYHMVLLEGNTIKPKRHMLGNNGLVDCGPNVDVVSSFDSWLQKGFPHHVCVVEGHHAKRFKALADMKDVTVVPNM